MIITREQFLKLPLEHREHILATLFAAQHQNFSRTQCGVDIDVPAGYSVRAAAILECDLPDEIVKKIFVLQQESNEFIERLDVAEFSEYAKQLGKTGVFQPDRDDLFVITPGKKSIEAYKNRRGKLVFMGVDIVLEGVEKKYASSRELRGVLGHYGFVKDADEESY